MQKIKLVLEYLIKHPVFLYFFILPVYITPRMLSGDFSSFSQITSSAYSDIYYFLCVIVLVATANSVLALTVLLLEKFNRYSEISRIDSLRVLSIPVSIAFIFSTHGLFFPSSKTFLYAISGLHYFCIAFLGNMVILEAKDYKSPLLETHGFAKQLSNAILGINLNSISILAFIIAATLIETTNAHYYGIYCVILVAFVLPYLLFAKKYLAVFAKIGFTRLFTQITPIFFLYLLAAMVCCIFSSLLSLNPYLIYLIIPISIICTYLLCRRVKKINVFALLSASSSYGIVLLAITTPVVMLFFDSSRQAMKIYTWSSILEPVFTMSCFVLILFLVFKKFLKNNLTTAYNCITFSGFASVIFLAALYITMHESIAAGAVIMFAMYAIIESSSRFGVRDIIMQEKGTTSSSILQYYNKLTTDGVMPVLLLCLLQIFGTQHLTEAKIFNAFLVMVAISFISAIALGYLSNIAQRP